MKVSQIAGSANGRNVTFHVRGFVVADMVLPPIETGHTNLKLSSLVWVIQEKMGLYLYWNARMKEEDLLLPMESRNSIRFDNAMGARAPENWDGRLTLKAFNTALPDKSPKAFFLILDFDR